MKLTTAIMFCFCLSAAAEGFSQTITYTGKNLSLKQIFTIVKKQTGYVFFYDAILLRKSKPVTISAQNVPVEQFLERAFKEQPLDYIIEKQTVTVVEKPTVNTPDHAAMPLKDELIKGKITDSTGQPLQGVTVLVKGSKKITTTDSDGNFSIEVPVNGSLVISYIGFETKEIKTGTNEFLNIQLAPGNRNLDEVVVVGYGTQSKKNVTGSVASVKAEDMNKSSAANFSQTLQGKAPGVLVTQATGQPGAGVSIQIRTNPSNANAGVLYVIDGVPINDAAGTPSTAIRYGSSGVDQSPLNFINPSDIESISFLKDASSAAIYGARAGAGVVLITTKKGSERKPIISYSGSYGIQEVDRLYDLLGTKDYMEQRNLITREKWMYDNKIGPYYGTVDESSVGTPTLPYTQSEIENAVVQPSAFDAIIRKGYIHQQNFSVSGGSKNTNYFLSGNYFDQRGILVGSGLRRYNTKLSIDHKLRENIRIGASMIMSNIKTYNVNTGGLYEDAGILVSATYWPADLPLRGDDGKSYPLNPLYQNTPNPASYETVTDFTNSSRSLTSAYVQWEIIKGLSAKGTLNYDQSQNKRNSYYPTTFLYGRNVDGAAAINVTQANSLSSEWTLNYTRRFLNNELKMDILGGYSYQRSNWEGVGAGNQQFVSDLLYYYSLGSGQSVSPTVSSYKSQNTWISGFSRANFIFKDKYVLQLSLRGDAASNFADNKKWGYFPSVSGSWLISEENFMNPVSFISELKLRAGYGETGNSSIGGGAYPLYTLSASPIFGTNQPSSGISLTQSANSNLSWETVAELNVGVDFGLFKNRLYGSIDVYSKTIKDMLTQIPLPADNITSYVWGNAGSVRANGWELSLSSKNVAPGNKNGFTWTTTLNLSHYYSFWKERAPAALLNLKGTPWIPTTGKDAPFRGVYGYEAEGIYKETWSKQPASMPGMLPGGIIIKDINGFDANGNLTGEPDGKISAADQKLLYTTDPELIFGFGNTFTFKGFDLNIFLSGMIQKGWDPTSSMGSASMNGRLVLYGWNVLNSVKDRWTYLNPEGNSPTGLTDPTYSGFQNNSNYYVVNSSFLRFRNITLGYSLPDNLLGQKKVFSSVRIFADLQNVFTITSKRYKGMDPELNQSNYYPFSKSYTMGLNITF
ncbi:TonB-dependent receptor [Terrimonas sp.]|uniref:TonB-dependent receptor n=1 Tax=Terrimonas sp. TaxID=1914338 RepID=UPI001401D7C4|nr:TonB-dependent receptor [Terrimonas sp.]